VKLENLGKVRQVDITQSIAKKKGILLLLIFAISFSLVGCSFGNSGTIDGTLPTSEQIDKALLRVDVSDDEYTGIMEITGGSESTVPIGEFSFVDTGAFLGKKPDEDWEFAVSSAYYAPVWLFQHSLGFKSTNGSMSIPLGSSDTEVNELAYVSEYTYVALAENEIEEFCDVMYGQDVTFRIIGKNGQVERKLPGGIMYDNRAMCVLYKGFSWLGLEITPK
jgi:hypothetical protein